MRSPSPLCLKSQNVSYNCFLNCFSNYKQQNHTQFYNGNRQLIHCIQRPIACEIHNDKNTERQTGTSERTIVLGQWPLQATVLAALRPDNLGILTRKKNPTRFNSIICTLCKMYIILYVRFGMIAQLFSLHILMKR